MKKMKLLFACCLFAITTLAQTYPQPEFSNEIYLLNKGATHTVTRLEKSRSKMQTKTKVGGMAGSETGYPFDGAASPVRLQSGNNLSFVFTTNSAGASSPQQDSVLRASGMDPAMMTGVTETDPSGNITLYKVESEKGGRKILLQKNSGMISTGKIKSSDKYSFSVKKIRNGYWELVVDRPLPKGEYAFATTTMADAGGMMGLTIFAFGID